MGLESFGFLQEFEDRLGLGLGLGYKIMARVQEIWATSWNLDLISSVWIHWQANIRLQETLNYWKQLPHILKYFRAEEDPNARRPQNFMTGFLEVSLR
jgi:hypothetical protein